MLNVVFFAALREQLRVDSLRWPVTHSIAELLSALQAQGEPWASALARPDLLCAKNQELCTSTEPLQDGDEVAFFPPVTGG